MKKYDVEFSKFYEFDYGNFYFSKITCNHNDNELGVGRKLTYYMWGTKELTDSVTIDINEWNVEPKDAVVKIDGKPTEMTLNYITYKK